MMKMISDADFDQAIDKGAQRLIQYVKAAKSQLIASGIDVSADPYLANFFKNPVASAKQQRRDPTMSTHGGRTDQRLRKKTTRR